MSDADLIAAFSPERMSTYLAATGGDTARTVALSDWNLDVSTGLFATLAVAEVVLRNSAHDRLSAWCQQRHGHARWFDELHHTIQGDKDLATAKRRAASAAAPSAGKVVAELSFGFWRYLFTRHYRAMAWSILQAAFPHHPRHPRVPLAPIGGRLGTVGRICNRIAHHEPLLTEDLAAVHRQMIELIEWISPAAAAWTAARDQVTATIARRP